MDLLSSEKFRLQIPATSACKLAGDRAKLTRTSRMPRALTLIPALLLSAVACAFAQTLPTSQPLVDGYRGIWFTLGQRSEHGDKYSGGLATYTAYHVPIAIHAAAANNQVELRHCVPPVCGRASTISG